MDAWNTSFLLGWPIFRCENFSFREGTTYHQWLCLSPRIYHALVLLENGLIGVPVLVTATVGVRWELGTT